MAANNQVLPYRVQPFWNTTDGWASDSTTIPVLGEVVIEQQPSGNIKFKLGDGYSTWSALPYQYTDGSGAFVGVAVPSTVPPVFADNAYYLCNEPGSYINFPTDGVGGYVIVPSDNILGVISYDTISGFWIYTEIISTSTAVYGTLDQVLEAGNESATPIVISNEIVGDGHYDTVMTAGYIDCTSQIAGIVTDTRLKFDGIENSFNSATYTNKVKFPVHLSRNTNITVPQRDGELAIVSDITLDNAIQGNNTTNRSAIWTNGTTDTLNVGRSGILANNNPSAGNSEQVFYGPNSIALTRVISSVSKGLIVKFATLLNSVTTLLFPAWRDGTLAFEGNGIAPAVAPGIGAGVGATATVVCGDDNSFVLSLTIGVGPTSASPLVKTTFNTAYPTNVRVVAEASNLAAISYKSSWYIDSSNITSSFSLKLDTGFVPHDGDVLLITFIIMK